MQRRKSLHLLSQLSVIIALARAVVIRKESEDSVFASSAINHHHINAFEAGRMMNERDARMMMY